MIYAAVILALTLFALYAASAWVMLRSVSRPRLEPIAWAITLAAIFAHSGAIVHVMRSVVPFSIGLFDAISILAWTLGVLAGFIAIERQNRALAAILLGSAAVGAAVTGTGHAYAVETARGCGVHGAYHVVAQRAAAVLAAAVAGVLLVVLDCRLRASRRGFVERAAADDTLGVVFRSIAAGFAMLTLRPVHRVRIRHERVRAASGRTTVAVAHRLDHIRRAVVRAGALGWRGRFALSLDAYQASRCSCLPTLAPSSCSSI